MSKDIPIGLKIKAIREARGLSQIEVVERLAGKGINMSRETLSKIENGNRTISAVELIEKGYSTNIHEYLHNVR